MPLSHIIGFDDAPFSRTHRGNVLVIGAVCAGARLEGIVSDVVRRDGVNATRKLADMISGSRFSGHVQLIMLQGIAVAGFNVVDVRALSKSAGLPTLVIARRPPDVASMRDALLTRIRGGARKWRLIDALGPMEPCAGVYVQRVGLSATEAEEVVRRTAVHGLIPEPLRMAHLIAGGVGGGESRGRT